MIINGSAFQIPLLEEIVDKTLAVDWLTEKGCVADCTCEETLYKGEIKNFSRRLIRAAMVEIEPEKMQPKEGSEQSVVSFHRGRNLCIIELDQNLALFLGEEEKGDWY